MCLPVDAPGCPSEDELAAWVRGLVRDETAARAIELHLDACAMCHALVVHARQASETARASRSPGAPFLSETRASNPPANASVLPDGARAGRYAILERTGQGAMGTVYAAYDPELDRRVALKMVRAREGEQAAELEERLRCEAKAMAKMAHANVVAIHDVGVSEAGVFLAMDYVDGVTLRSWLAAAPRRPEEILAKFIEAGRGLAAAHRAGIIHRDFKPDNVLVGRDGHVRVSDFGLAHINLPADEDEACPSTDAPSTTQPGPRTLVGTPAYMAPEQLEGAEVDARADVFAFAVALWEALTGAPPFTLASAKARLLAIRRGELVAAPRGRMPARIARCLARAMAGRPDARWPTMEGLLAQLAPPRRTTAWVAAGVVLLAVAVAAAYRGGAAGRSETCLAGRGRVEAAWGDRQRAAMRAAMLTSQSPAALDAWSASARRLDEYSRDWAAQHQAACEATRKTGEQSEALLDRRMHCLDRRLDEMSSLVTLLSQPDPALLENAARAAHSLSRLAACSESAALLAPVPLPADAAARATVEALGARLARNRALGLAGKYDEQLAELVGLVAEARRLEYSPVLAEALILQGTALGHVEEFKRATEAMLEAGYCADAGGDRKLAARARAELVYLVGRDLGDHTRALEYARDAEARLRGLGGDPELEALVASHEAAVLASLGRIHDVKDLIQRALRLREAALGPDDIQTADARENLGFALNGLGDRKGALALARRALETYRQKLGEHHPSYAHALLNIASAEANLGISDAKKHVEQSRDLLIEAHGPVNSLVAAAENNLGAIALRAGQLAEASVHSQRALSISEKVRGPDHVLTAGYRLQFASTLRLQGRPELARKSATRALAALEKVGGDVAGCAWTELSEISEALGHHDQALREAERAVGLLDRDASEDVDDQAGALFVLAKRLATKPATAKRAHEVATRALGVMSEGNPDRAQILAWLSQHPVE